MRVMRDTAIITLIAGTAGGIAKSLVVQLMLLLGVSKISIINLAASLLFPYDQVFTWQGRIVGLLAHFSCSVLFAIALMVIFYLTGTDYHSVKGMAFGMGAWFINLCFIAKFTDCLPVARTDFPTLMVFLLGHLVYGWVTAYTAVKLKIFSQS
ncbi:hypothetical protein [Calderihabitans maritimus]|uniref:DUF1440 domain-containing protein n=1 Tax=Calderihabitans maritimus TaxID=1246530 RepID=A0A1Z5HX42_9FIRM|nr:hypothetical protein [Calderihabitans maritimus]GAW94096.1 hypothetical protein TherJR_2533 [Calderihabitans maritimus]